MIIYLLPVVIAYLVTLLKILYWMYYSQQETVERSATTTRRVVFRLLILFVALGFIVWVTDVGLLFVVIIASFIVLSTFVGDLVAVGGLPAVGLFLLIKDFVLGFPELVLAPERRNSSTDEPIVPQKMLGQKGQLTTNARPQGSIEIDGETWPAASESGVMLERGLYVKVVGVRNGTLMVAEIEPGSPS